MSIGIRKFKKTKVGSMPEDWQILKIKNVAETSSGGTPSRNNKEYFKGSTPWVKTGELTNKYLEKTEECISKLAIKNSSAKVFPKGTILMAMYGATIGKMSILNVDASCNQACCSIIPDKSKASTEYIYYALEYRKSLLISMRSGGAQPNISQQIIKVFEIPLPEIVEQEKIAEILSTVDADIKKTDAIVKETQQLKKGLMGKLFTDGIGYTRFKKTKIGRIPDVWNLMTLKSMMDKGIILGHLDGNHGSLYPRANEFVDDGIPYLVANCLVNGRVNFSCAKYLTKEKASTLRKGFAQDLDVLFAHNATVGPVGILKTDKDCVILSTSLTYYRCEQSKLNPYYLYHFMGSEFFSKQYKRVMKQTTRNQVPITTQRTFYHLIPLLEEQNKIADILSEFDTKIENEQNYKTELEQLKKGLLQVLLTGKVRVKV